MRNREIRSILRRFEELRSAGEPCALATVISVRGSAYRRPGARMLFSRKGREAGFVSAACLEADVYEKVKEVIVSQKPVLVSYDTTAPEDAIFGIGQGCAGFLEILIEPVPAQQNSPFLQILQTTSELHESCAIATVYRSSGPDCETVGMKFLRKSNGENTSLFVHEELQTKILFDVEQALRDGCSMAREYIAAESSAAVFIEICQPPLQMVVFGATPDVRPLVRLAAGLGWSVMVVDHRAAYAVKSDFPEADTVCLLSPDEYASRLRLTPETYAVIMIHQFVAEAKTLQFLLSSGIRYIGLLGPKSKCELLLQHLAAEGYSPTSEQVATLHSPVGLDLGAETSEEIALSIAAEILTIAKNRKPGFLRDRQGAIH